MHQAQAPENPGTSGSDDRRDFLKKGAALCLGTLAIVAPVVSGTLVILDPLRRKSAANEPLMITLLSSLPDDGLPRKFVVVASHADAWNRNPSVPVGAVYLRRTGPKTVKAFNVVCPHAGCFVDFVAARQGYLCPCHNSSFDLEGKISDSRSPSPRGLDELAVEIRNDSEVWVQFQNYLAGHEQKVPVA